MKKKILSRVVFGFPTGLALGYVITIMISFFWGNGYYSPCMPELISLVGNEIGAVALQALLCGIIGSAFAASSVIWEIDHWSIAKQTGLYFLICSAVMLPIAYFTHWMEHSIAGFFIYFGIFVLIFVIIWITQFIIGKYHVRKWNAQLQAGRKQEE